MQFNKIIYKKLYYDELKEYEENQIANENFEEEMLKRNDFILWFMSELSKEKDGDTDVNNPKTK